MPDLTHVQRIRQEMPVTTSHLYLNTGTFGPLPNCVALAMQERIQYELQNGRLGAAAFETMGKIYDNARSSAARLLHADPGEIALTVEGDTYALKAGDAFFFASMRPHGVANPGEAVAMIVWVNTPPTL